LKSFSKPPSQPNRFAPLSVEFEEGTKGPLGSSPKERYPTLNTKDDKVPQPEENDNMNLGDEEDNDSACSSKANASSGSQKSLTLEPASADTADNNHTNDNVTEQPPQPKPPVEIRLTAHEPEWRDDESDGEAACSSDERSPPRKNLQDVVSTPSTVDSTATTSSLSTLSNPSTMLDPSSGQTLLTVEMQLQPNKEHLQTMFDELKNLLAYIQILDPSAVFISRGLKPDHTPLPNLDSPTSPHWPITYATAVGWFQSSTGYVFKQKPVTESELAARLETRRNRNSLNDADGKRRNTKKGHEKEDRGPTSIYVTVNLFSGLPDIRFLIESMNIDLRKSNLRVSVKALQCWESQSRKMLCSVQSNLCIAGVKQLLLHRLKETEKKLCRHGRMSTLEWYDTPLPDINVSIRTIRELRLPNDPKEREQLSFDPFPRASKFAYFLEASDAAWIRLEPLLQTMIDTNDLMSTFGPSACIMEVPEANPNIDRVRAHHKHGRISMGYNLATTIIECCEVQLYDYEVKVRMEPVEVTDEAGKGTGQYEIPKPPYSCTTLRKELQRICFNGQQVFHTAFMIGKGPETGMSSIVVAYDPHDPVYCEKYKFARKTSDYCQSCLLHVSLATPMWLL
jgi:hypothetical protein